MTSNRQLLDSLLLLLGWDGALCCDNDEVDSREASNNLEEISVQSSDMIRFVMNIFNQKGKGKIRCGAIGSVYCSILSSAKRSRDHKNKAREWSRNHGR